ATWVEFSLGTFFWRNKRKYLANGEKVKRSSSPRMNLKRYKTLSTSLAVNPVTNIHNLNHLLPFLRLARF
ncbi:MAG: hypothetical protein NWQ42_02765, partial [Alishewanella sp.]|nr:hypothetical protein [Alishewanella sp.]